MSAGHLGEFEQMVLLAIVRLGQGAYGMAIRDELKVRVGRDVSRGGLYVTLDRLESKGLIGSRLAEPTPVRGGRAKRFVQVTTAGMAELRKSRRALLELWAGIEPLLDGGVR